MSCSVVDVVVGHDDVADLSFADEFLERRRRLLGRSVRVGPVDLGVEEVDPQLQGLVDTVPAVLEVSGAPVATE